MTKPANIAAPVAQRAYSIEQFCSAYSIGRTKVYYEEKCGRLRLTRLGGRTLILVEDAERWIADVVACSPAPADVHPRRAAPERWATDPLARTARADGGQ